MSEIDKFFNHLKKDIATSRQAQFRFAICKQVDWNERTMTAIGVSDDLEYFNVQLGFGYTDIKPATGTTCLIGILEGQETYTFLVNAEKVELVEIIAEKVVYNSGENAGWVKVKELTQKLNAIEQDLNDLKQLFANWVTVPNDGGAALKALSATWAGQQLITTQQAEIENNKATH